MFKFQCKISERFCSEEQEDAGKDLCRGVANLLEEYAPDRRII